MEVMEVRGSSLTRLVMCANITLTDWRRAYNNGGRRPNAEQRCCCMRLQVHQCMIELHWIRCSEEGKEQIWNGKWMWSSTQIANGFTWVHRQEARACQISAQRTAQHQTHVDVMRELARPLHCAKHVNVMREMGAHETSEDRSLMHDFRRHTRWKMFSWYSYA